MKTRLYCLFVLLCWSVHFYAYDFYVNGFYFEKETSGNTVKIVAGDVPYSGSIVIPSEVNYDEEKYIVTTIGMMAFRNCNALSSITIPNSVTLIEMYAFSKCDHLEEVIIEDGTSTLTTWYDDENWYQGTFSNCPLKHVYQGRNLFSEHGMYNAPAFKGISTLTEITLSDKVTHLSDNAFSGCSALEQITLPESLVVIGRSAFAGCSSLKAINIPASVKAIGFYVSDLTFNNDYITHDNAFANCPRLEKITVANGNIVYDSRNNCNGIIVTSENRLLTGCKTTIIPQSVTSIGPAFNGCSTLTEISIPSTVTTLESMAFYGTSLKHVDLPSSINNMGLYVFDCPDGMKLDSITVHWDSPDKVTCDYRAFGGDVWAAVNSQAQLRIPEGTYAFYANRNPWMNFGIIAEGDAFHLRAGHQLTFEGIEYRLIDNENHLTICKNNSYKGTITIPATFNYKGNTLFVSQLEEWAFGASPALTAVHFPQTITSIPKSALYGCEKLEEVTFEEGSQLTEIMGDAFKNCKALKTFQMPNGVKIIANGAFSNCSSLEHITFPEGLTQLNGFDGCTSLKEIVLPNSLLNISDFCFNNCTSVTHVQLPANITNIGMYTFSIMLSLTSFTALATTPPSVNGNAFAATPIKNATLFVPIGCKDVYANAYYWKDFKEIIEINGQGFRFTRDGIAYEITNADDMEVMVCSADYSGDITIPEIVEFNDGMYVVLGINDEAFKNCTQLTSISIPRFITSIGNEVFSGCTALRTVKLPDDLTTIGNRSFYNCKGLKSITIPASVKRIGQEAFAYSSGLERIEAYPIIPPTCDDKVFNGISKYLCKLYVVENSIDSYAAANQWQDFRNIVALQEYILGDVNDDGTVDISDYIGVANHILGNTPAGFNETAADVNSDGSIDISDYIGVANIILTGKP